MSMRRIGKQESGSPLDGREPAAFAEVLRSALEEDNGLILRVAAYERLIRDEAPVRGWTARLVMSLIRRSRKIFDSQPRRIGATEG